MMWFRVRVAAVLASLGLAACAVFAPPAEHIVETATGRSLGCAELAEAVLASRFALLGEQHDEPTHHQRRGALIERLHGTPAAVVAEHLPRGDRVLLQGPRLLGSLEAAGFRPRAWDWPVHQALFEGIAASGLPLFGGDLTGDELRSLMQPGGGAAALPAPMQRMTAAAPLDEAARRVLDADLSASHGGAGVPAARLDAMRNAQRARDASLLLALQHSHGTPALLVAGNGHVRGDYGVPQLLRATLPQAAVLNVALVRAGDEPPGGARVYTHVWYVDPAVPRRSCGP